MAQIFSETTLMDNHWNQYKQEYGIQSILLANFLEIDPDVAQSLIDEDDYLVLTDKQADEVVRDYIKETVWAFKPSFLSQHTGVDEEIFTNLADRCESNNKSYLRMIKDLDEFIEDAVSQDGRGHFMDTYDGNEHEVVYNEVVSTNNHGTHITYHTKQTPYYIYRRN
jgi:hypothetical protein